MTITYRSIKDFPGYRMTSDGNIQSNKPSKVKPKNVEWITLKPGMTNIGYQFVHLYKGGKGYARLVHRLMLECFIGKRKQGQECRHLDSDPSNNCLTNLCWGTHAENMEDRKLTGKPCAKQLTADQVNQIRQLRHDGLMMRSIGVQLDIKYRTVSDVLRGRHFNPVDVETTP